MFSTIKSIFSNKTKELELRERELALREKELELKDKEMNLKVKSFDEAIIVEDVKEVINTKKREFTTEEKKAYALRMKEQKDKGLEFEKFVAGHFKLDGYEIVLNGIKRGKKDKGIDIVCTKDDELILIQCKNWKKDSKYKIKHTHLKEFIGNCTVYVNDNNLLEKKTKLKFITSNYILDASAKNYLEENRILQHEIYNF
jgi:restriction system protein